MTINLDTQHAGSMLCLKAEVTAQSSRSQEESKWSTTARMTKCG